MRDLKKWCALALLCVLLMLPVAVFADETVEDVDDSLEQFIQDNSSLLPSPQDVYVFDDSVPDSVLDDEVELYASNYAIEPFAVTGTVYDGTIPTQALDYFKGFLAHRPGTPYVAFRLSQYDYYLFYGKDLKYSGGRFSGSGDYVRYYSYNGTIHYGSDTVNVNRGNGFVYSNLDESFAAFYEERGLLNEKTVLVVLCSFLVYWVVSKFFRRNRAG